MDAGFYLRPFTFFLTMLKKYPRSALAVSILGIYVVQFGLLNRCTCSLTQPAKYPRPIFNQTYITDNFVGDLDLRDKFVVGSDISIIFYYAHWCQTSINAAREVEIVAERLHEQVKFVAVNCFWNRGQCRQEWKVDSFPVIHILHPMLENPVEYTGPLISKYLLEFVRKSFFPVIYLDSNEAVERFHQRAQISIMMGISNPSLNDEDFFERYVRVAVASLSQYPALHFQLGVVTSPRLRRQHALRDGIVNVYDAAMSDLHPARKIDLRASSDRDVLDFLFRDPEEWLVTRIFTSQTKSNALYKSMQRGPALLGFFSESRHFQMLEELAVEYHRNCPRHSAACCVSLAPLSGGRRCSACLLSAHPSCALRFALSRFLLDHALPPSGRCTYARAAYDGSRLRVCCGSSRDRVSGEACRSNRTLQFVAFDAAIHGATARKLGVAAPPGGVVLVDAASEEEFRMSGDLSKRNIARHITRFGNHQLTSTRILPTSSRHDDVIVPSSRGDDVATTVTSHQDDEGLTIRQIYAHNFNSSVLHNTEDDVLVYYSSSWCALCALYSHHLVEFQRRHFAASVRTVRVDSAENARLPWPFVALSFPTLVLYPANRSANSVVYPSHVPFSTNQLVRFVLRHGSPNTRAQIVESICGDHRQQVTHRSKLLAVCNRLRSV